MMLYLHTEQKQTKQLYKMWIISYIYDQMLVNTINSKTAGGGEILGPT